MPTELDLQDLCAEGAESEELEGPWTSLFVFIALFLLSVSYSATVTLFKVGAQTGPPGLGGGVGEAQREGDPRVLGPEPPSQAPPPR